MEHERRTMTLSLTYDDLAERLGITRNAARVLAQRRKWSRYTSQEDGKARVRVPEDELERLGARQSGPSAGYEPPHDVHPVSGEVEALKDHVRTLRELLDERNAAHAAEVARLIEASTRIQNELQETRAEADHAKADQVRMARDVATMFDELKAMADRHAELHADRGRLQAEGEQKAKELDQARAELARARRPWWRRVIGR
jgi:DNA repair ATPase RecN